MTFSEAYEKYEDEFSNFSLIENKKSKRADLHAFILLDLLCPEGGSDIISAAEHDEIYLEISPDLLSEKATEEQMLELIRCGVRYDSDTDSLTMFV